MSLSGLLPLLYSHPAYSQLARALASGGNASAEAPIDSARPYMLAGIHADVTSPRGRAMIVVSSRSERARRLYEGLLAYSPPGTPIYFFPAPDLLPYERIAPDPTIVGERLRVLAALQGLPGRAESPDENAPTAPIVVTSVFALMHPTMAPADMAHARRLLRRGEMVQLRDLLSHLVDLGYESSPLVEEPGQFSRRGGIVDIFPPTSALPIRIEFFGDEIDSIRLFNPLTQRSERQAQGLVITPSCELPLWRREEAAEQLALVDTSTLRDEVLEEWQEQMQQVRAGECFEGMELFAPYYTQPLASLADYLQVLRERPNGDGTTSAPASPPDPAALPLLVLDDPAMVRLEAEEIERQAAELYQGFVDNGELPQGVKRPYLTWEEVTAHGRGLPLLALGGGAEGALEAPPFSPSPVYASNIAGAISDIQEFVEGGSRVIIVSQQSGRLRELLEDADIYPTVRKGAGRADAGRGAEDGDYIAGVETVGLSEGGPGVIEALGVPPAPGSVNLLQGSLQAGWQLGGGEGGAGGSHDVILVTDAELFVRSQIVRRPQRQTSRSTADAAAILREKMLLELQPGDYVVHVEHGIAKYGGLVRMNNEGTEREYMLLLYAEGDRLYVPADQTDRVAPYIGTGPPPHLHRLGTAEWSRTKRRVKEAADVLARELLQLYAARETAPGHAYPPDTPWQHELEESFPYIETTDQLRAISEVKTTWSSPARWTG